MILSHTEAEKDNPCYALLSMGITPAYPLQMDAD